MSRTSLTTALILSLLAVATVAGCASPAVDTLPAPNPVVTNDGGDAGTGDTSGGDFPTQEIPDTFPSDAVPLVDGQVVFAIDLGTGWSLLKVVDDPAASYAEAVGLLEAAGFETSSETQADAGSFASLDGADLQVQVTAGDDPDFGPSIGYVVIIKG